MTQKANGKYKYLTLPAININDIDMFSNFRLRTSCSFEIADNTSAVKIYLQRPRGVFYVVLPDELRFSVR